MCNCRRITRIGILLGIAVACIILYDAVRLHRASKLSLAQVSLRAKLKSMEALFPPQTDTSFATYELNVSLSNSIPLWRPIPDDRPKQCLDIQYDIERLPKVSIIIPFHNEAWSLLLRALNSVIFRTPESLIKEIILVDDESTYSYLREPLEKYIAPIPKTRLLRMPGREGLIRTRLAGARAAQGEVLVFLDAHVEVNTGWLEPLLAAIAGDNSTIAVPHMNTIHPWTIKYGVWKPEVHGGFSWTMDYVWKQLPEYLSRKRLSEADPIRTPTTIGCAFAVDRQYFFHIGAYDEGLFIWGGENLEISFKTWLCGGSLYIYPCSRVAHMFRDILPYTFPDKYNGTKVIDKNYQRISEIWLDEYKDFYYAARHEKPSLNQKEMSQVAQLKAAKKKTKCKRFYWYLENIIPEMFIPWKSAVYQGSIKNLVSMLCLSANSTTGSLDMSFCSKHTEQQKFYLSHNGRLYHNITHCVAFRDTALQLGSCESQEDLAVRILPFWYFNTTVPAGFENDLYVRERQRDLGRITMMHNGTALDVCLLQVTSSEQRQQGGLAQCEDTQKWQYWTFTYKMDFNFHSR